MILRILLFLVTCTLSVQAYSPLSIYEANGDLLFKDPIGITLNGFSLAATNGEVTVISAATGTVTSVNNGDTFSEVATGTAAAVITINNGLFLQDTDLGVTVQRYSAAINGTTASFLTGDETKLDNIEALADVTDTANVTSAGALMDSEVDADIKTLALPASTTISAFGATLVDDAAASNARTTLGVDASGTDNSTDVTLAGSLDYLTIVGQAITRAAIDLTTDVTGDLPVAEGGTGSSTAGAARTALGVAIGSDVQAHDAVLDATTASFLTADETKLDAIEALADVTDAANITTAGALLKDGTVVMTGELDMGTNSVGFTVQTATGDGTTTIDWGAGNKFDFTFGAFNETFTFTAPTSAGNFLLRMVQDGVGSRTATWPATVKWPGGVAPTLTTAASSVDIVTCYYNGTTYDCNSGLDFK